MLYSPLWFFSYLKLYFFSHLLVVVDVIVIIIIFFFLTKLKVFFVSFYCYTLDGKGHCALFCRVAYLQYIWIFTA